MKISKDKHPCCQTTCEWILFAAEIFHNFLTNLLAKIFEITKVRQHTNSRVLIVCNEHHIQLHLTIACISGWIGGRNEKQASYNAHPAHKFVYRSFRNGWNIGPTGSLTVIFV